MQNNLNIPNHICIILDGNGRWAKKRFLPRVAGHIKGVQAVKKTVKSCLKHGVKYLTLFAFSSENWKRPTDEVSFLMKLLQHTLNKEANNLKNQNIYLRIIGDINNLPNDAQEIINSTLSNQVNINGALLNLTVAINYGGKWDITNAMNKWLEHNPQNKFIDKAEDIEKYLSMSDCPDPDLLIRTGGEQRISNFLLWQLAYAELYFTQEFWPEFNEESLLKAMQSYSNRERRFGKTSEQIIQNI